MKNSEQKRQALRRRFLKGILALGGGMAVTASRTAPATEAPTAPARRQHDSGYQETPHVLDYYDKARF